MICPFYLAIAVFTTESGEAWTESTEINSEEVDIGDYHAVLRAFPATKIHTDPKRLILVSSNTSGGPSIVQDWG